MTDSMLLINGEWNGKSTFKMIPIHKDCPFLECIFDPNSKILAVISKDKKTVFQMVPKIDENGDAVLLKLARPNGRTYKEERRIIETFYEYYITGEDSIRNFVRLFCFNAGSFDYEKFIEESLITHP
jgi:hypothetical protein